MPKSNKFDKVSELLATLRTDLTELGYGDAAKALYFPEEHKDIVLIASQMSKCATLIASRDLLVIEKVDFLNPLAPIVPKLQEASYMMLTIEEQSEATSSTKPASPDATCEDHEHLFQYIEQMYQLIASKKQYNQYLNERDKYTRQFEQVAKKKMRKQMRRLMPLVKRIMNSIDREALNEAMDMVKTKEFAKVGQDIVKRLMMNEFDMEKAFQDYDGMSELGIDMDELAVEEEEK